MKPSKLQRIILIIILSIFLLSIPLYNQIYYVKTYYVFTLLFAAAILISQIFNWQKKLDQRFYLRWSKSRKRGKWPNIILGGLNSLLYILIIVSIGQFFGRGLTPMDIVRELSSEALPIILPLIIIISFTNGILSWVENEKRYDRIYWNKEKDNM